MLGRWKPEGSDIYMRAYGGRVARLQAIYADAARSENREEELDEKEISARLGDWLRTGGKLKETMADLLAQQLREDWASERIGENGHDTIAEDLEGEVGDEIPEESGSATDEGIPRRVLDGATEDIPELPRI